MTWLLLLLTLLQCDIVIPSFLPDYSDYDAYGLKIAGNDVSFVEAENYYYTFYVQYAPYNATIGSLQCPVYYDDAAHYIYSVGVGSQQTNNTNPYFYFAGEVANVYSTGTDASGRNGTFIGVWINRDPLTVQNYVTNGQPISCNYFYLEQLEFLSSYDHQEFFVIAVEPYGNYAIGLATEFAFIYQPYPNSTMTVESSSVVWPKNATFNPWAADASETFTIVAGFLVTTVQHRTQATPTVYLMSNTNLTILSTWSYTPANNSWQSRLGYSDISTWKNKYIMSVKINPNDSTRVLIGMSFLSTVFLFNITDNGTNLTFVSSMNNGVSPGYGKGVTWLTDSQVAFLVSTYSSDYLTWYSSKIYLYTLVDRTTLPLLPTAVFPNIQQTLPSAVNAHLIQIISTPESLAVLDINSYAMMISPEPPGYYASTGDYNPANIYAVLVVSNPKSCIAGTYKSDAGIQACALCPSGSRNPGNTPATSCINCSSTGFCPLGAAYDVDPTAINSISQAYAYPQSPELVVYDDILLQNMFSLSFSVHCMIVSPIFWTLILVAIFLLLFLIAVSMNWCLHPTKRDQWHATIKHIFRRTDLLGEGELWIGGLASIIIVLVSTMAYAFSASYMNQYPAEKVGPSSFACDLTLRNAKFDSTLQALAVPILDEEQPIFDLLNEQNFTLQFEFVNTNASCTALSISDVTDSSNVLLTPSSCSNLNGILSVVVPLEQHIITVEALLNDIQLVGGIRLGLLGPGQQNGLYSLQDLDFIQSMYSSSAGTLAQQFTIELALTKIVNETEPLYGGDSNFDGIWYPTFTYRLNQMFVDANGYFMFGNLSSTTITVQISETLYYMKNVQSPIAKQTEIIFRTLLFTIVCLEICGLVFVICKLLIIPLYQKLYALCFTRPSKRVHPEHELESVDE